MFSLEMPTADIVRRFISMISGVPFNKIDRGVGLTPEDVDAINRATGPEGLHGLKIYIDDRAGLTAPEIGSVIRRAVVKRGLSMAVVDYLQMLRPDERVENRVQQVTLMSQQMKQIARQCNIPVVCLAQLNRQLEARGNDRPKLSDLRDSGSIEQDADVVLLLHRRGGEAQEGDEIQKIDVIVAKQRNGPTGDIPLAYRKKVMRFESLEVPQGSWTRS
jgi:replicative DNA helicase